MPTTIGVATTGYLLQRTIPSCFHRAYEHMET